MHRKNHVPRVLLGSLLLLGLCVAAPEDLRAQGGADKAPAISGSVTVAINGTQVVRMSGKQILAAVKVDKRDIVDAKGVDNDQTAVRLVGLAPGIARVTLTGADGKEETFEVVVQTDIELLGNVLQRAVPTANVRPIPGAGNAIILTGWVARAEDVQVIMDIARTFTAGGVGGAAIVNALKVGGVQQVQLDVVVARVARTELRRMGFDWTSNGQQHLFTSSQGGIWQFPSTGSITGGGVEPLEIPNQIITAPNMFLGIFTQDRLFFFFLEALRENRLAKVLAEPHLVTQSGRPATFNAGGEQAVPVVSGLGGTAGVQFQPFGTLLTFVPIVLGNGKIYLDMATEVSALDAANGTTLPGGGFVSGRQLQRVQTAVEIEPGQTLAVGGLIQNTVQGQTIKVPVLGDLPFIGAAFSRKQYTETEEEVVIMVTPHLVDAMDCSQLPKYLPGQETRTPDDFELFLEGILEAPRGQRNTCPDRRYKPAFKNSPTLGKFPCGDGNCADGNCANGNCANGNCANGNCANGNCAGPVGETAAAPAYPTAGAPVTIVQEPAGLPPSLRKDAEPAAPSSVPAIVPVSGPGFETVPASLPAPR